MSRNATGYDVCTAVIGHLPFDARVWKEVTSLSAAGYSIKLIGNRYDITETLRYSKDGVDVVEFPFGSRSEPSGKLSKIRSVVKVWIEALRTKAKVYHAHNIHTVPAMKVAARRRGAKLVYDGHELNGEPASAAIADRAKARVLWLAERYSVLRSDEVITTNVSRGEALRKRHGRDDIVILPNVPRRVDEVVPVDPGFPPGVPVLLYQGGIYAEQRAFYETIEALRELPGLHFVVLGFGRERDLELIGQWAIEHEVEDRVHLLPPEPFERLVHTAANAQIGLVPLEAHDLGCWLGDTNKLHEYLMAGVPVVGSAFPEVERVVVQGDPAVGETFDPADPSSIASAIRQVLEDPRYDERKLEARRLALEEHNWETASIELLGLYGRLIGPCPLRV